MKYWVCFISLIFWQKLFSHHKIYSPQVEEGRQSFEWRGHTDFDDRELKNKAHHHVLETEYSWTHYWQSEIEFHISDKEDTPFDWEKTELQNQVQILDFKNFAAALYFSYNFISEGYEADEIEYKYLNQFYNESLSFISNFIFEKQVGSSAEGSTTFSLSNSLMFNDLIIDDLSIGFFGFSDFGEISDTNTFSQQKHQYGLQFESEFEFNDIEYEWSIGYLHGFTDVTANHSLVWNFEVEFN
tara:strand:+ start:453 stop:1178 length:726 start_codon:yes stop_codon:yes gene_type:complete